MLNRAEGTIYPGPTAPFSSRSALPFLPGLPAASRPGEMRRSGAHLLLFPGLLAAWRPDELRRCGAHFIPLAGRGATRAARVGGFPCRGRAGCAKLAGEAASHRACGAISRNPTANLATAALSGAGRRPHRIALARGNPATDWFANRPARSAVPGRAAACRRSRRFGVALCQSGSAHFPL